MIELTADFSSVVNGLAAGDAYASLDTNVAYWKAIVDYAFAVADDEFHRAAAAYAQTGQIKHMFEWGTLGVNRNATNVRPTPMEERARLWKDYIVNKGPKGGVSVGFEYKPSIADVPISTVIPIDIRALMRKHQFKWKARVMEEGTPVHIERKDAEFLLIPYSPGMTGFRPHDIKRGYTLTRATIQATPGRKVHGTFTTFWTRYWNSRGAEKMDESLREQIETDFLPYFASNVGKKRAPGSIVQAVRTRSEELQKEVAAKAKARRTRRGK